MGNMDRDQRSWYVGLQEVAVQMGVDIDAVMNRSLHRPGSVEGLKRYV